MNGKNPLCLVAFILVLVGALNWGLVGLGMLIGSDLNLVKALFGAWPTVEAIVYLLVGVAAIGKIAVIVSKGGCCKGGKCEKA